MKYVNFVKDGTRLRIELLAEGKEFINDAIADGKNIHSDDLMFEFFEHQLCNGWNHVRPEEIGALTDHCPLLSDTVERNDKGEVTGIDSLYHYMEYATKSPLEELLKHGEIAFHRHDCKDGKA